MKQKKAKSGKRKRIVLFILMFTLVVGIVGVYLIRSRGQRETTQSEEKGFFQRKVVQENGQNNVVSAYGIVSIGVTEEILPITNLENELVIEEVYISSGESITGETALFKVTPESLESVRVELEEELRAADLAMRAGTIEYEQSKITAYYEKEKKLLTGKQADAVYQSTISGLYEDVQQAKTELEDVRVQIAEQEAAIASNTYYEDYQVEYYKNLYEENKALLIDKIEEWGVAWNEVTGSGMNLGMNGSAGRYIQNSSVSGGDNNQKLHSQYVSILASLYKILEQNLADYEQAQSSYEEAVENSDYQLEKLKLQLSSLEQKYAEAKLSYENSLLQAQLTKEKTLSDGEKAESNFEADMEKAEADYQALQDEMVEAQNNLVLFETYIADGKYYANSQGTLLRVNVRAGSAIGSESRLYTLRNAEEITVTVSVSQSDIAKLSIGDTAMIQSTDSGMYSGFITAVNPIASSDSKTSVTYNVTVAITGEVENLTANETVTVYFGMGNGEQRNEN
ncbi:MAG: HlyD family efflux transporter periplasmic adaptor subunit [Lachnospiraceae bacterium]|nr:HlyD family efflux transporter periplasmic adaptor subunit [Lachnospiraceae bacterium]